MNYKHLLVFTVLFFTLTSVQSRYETEKLACISVVDKISDDSYINTTPDMMNDVLIFPGENLATSENKNILETNPLDTDEEVSTTEETTTFDMDNKLLIDAPRRLCPENMKHDRRGVCRPIMVKDNNIPKEYPDVLGFTGEYI